MVASQAALADSAKTIALEMAEHIETLAAAGEWEEVEDIVVRLKNAVLKVPEPDRRAVIVAVQQSLDVVAAAAHDARQDVTIKVTELRRGQAAKKAYELR